MLSHRDAHTRTIDGAVQGWDQAAELGAAYGGIGIKKGTQTYLKCIVSAGWLDSAIEELFRETTKIKVNCTDVKDSWSCFFFEIPNAVISLYFWQKQSKIMRWKKKSHQNIKGE